MGDNERTLGRGRGQEPPASGAPGGMGFAQKQHLLQLLEQEGITVIIIDSQHERGQSPK